MIQFLPAILALAKEIPAVKRLMDKVPEPMQEAAAAVLTNKLIGKGVHPDEPDAASYSATIVDVVDESETEILEYCQQNLSSARETYTHERGSKVTADSMALAIMRWNPAYIAVLIGALIGTIVWVDDKGAVGIVSAAIGAALNQLYNERNSVMAFYYASMEGVEKLLTKK